MINREEFLEVFRSVFDETEPKEVNFETSFKCLDEWSSLTLLALIATMEDSFSATLTAKDIEKLTTVEELYSFVNS